jgi:hypothetical protein
VNSFENDYHAKLVCGTTEGNQQTPKKLDTTISFETILLNAPIEQQQLKKNLTRQYFTSIILSLDSKYIPA